MIHSPHYRYSKFTKDNLLSVTRFMGVVYRRGLFWLTFGTLLISLSVLSMYSSSLGDIFSSISKVILSWIATTNICLGFGLFCVIRGLLALLFPRSYYLLVIGLYHNTRLALPTFFCAISVFSALTWAINQPATNFHCFGWILYGWVILRLVFFLADYTGNLERASSFDHTVRPKAGFENCFRDDGIIKNNEAYNRGLESALGASPGTFGQGS